MQLRPYQEHDLDAVRSCFRTSRKVLLVQPTAAGKGTLASYIVRNTVRNGKDVIFAVNRRTIVNDMAERLERLGIEHGVIMGDDKRSRPWLHTHVASIDTLHRRTNRPRATAGEYARGPVTTNSVESVWAVLKRGLHGVYHHASRKHLARYVDEFTFRLNAGNVARHTLERLESFVASISGKRITYKELTA